MKLKIIFKLIQGHQITDKEIYHSMGDVPVRTGRNEIKGYWNKTIINKNDLPCITYPTKGNPGQVYVQHKLFDANNTAILIPHPAWRTKINLRWISFKLIHHFLDIQTSKGGVSYLNKEIVEELDIEIPPLNLQKKELKYFLDLKNLKNKCEVIQQRYSHLKSTHLIYYTNNETILNNYLDYISRNDSLTEEEIYRRSQNINKRKEKIEVISGTIGRHFGIIPYDELIHHIQNRPCIQVVRVGKAGTLNVLKKGNYAPNSNTMLLYIKEKKLLELNIKNEQQEINYLTYIASYLQPIFYEIATSSDLSVFPLSEVIKTIKMDFVKYSTKIENRTKLFNQIENSIKDSNVIIDKINNIMKKEIIKFNIKPN